MKYKIGDKLTVIKCNSNLSLINKTGIVSGLGHDCVCLDFFQDIGYGDGRNFWWIHSTEVKFVDLDIFETLGD